LKHYHQCALSFVGDVVTIFGGLVLNQFYRIVGNRIAIKISGHLLFNFPTLRYELLKAVGLCRNARLFDPVRFLSKTKRR